MGLRPETMHSEQGAIRARVFSGHVPSSGGRTSVKEIVGNLLAGALLLVAVCFRLSAAKERAVTEAVLPRAAVGALGVARVLLANAAPLGAERGTACSILCSHSSPGRLESKHFQYFRNGICELHLRSGCCCRSSPTSRDARFRAESPKYFWWVCCPCWFPRRDLC